MSAENYLEDQIEDLRQLVISLIEKQGLVVSNYSENTVCTPEEEELAEQEWSRKFDETMAFIDESNKKRSVKYDPRTS